MKNKGVIIGSLVIVAGAVYFIATSNSKNKKDVTNTTVDNGTTTTPPNSTTPPVNTSDVTPGLNFGQMANDLFAAMNGYCTNEDKIEEIFNSLKTDADFTMLYNAYGTRKLSSGAGNIFSNDFTGDLIESIQNECSGSEIFRFNNIFLQKGMTIGI